MKITYDLEVLPPRKRPAGGRGEETLALIAFLAGKQKNMKIDYDDPKECKRKYDTLRNYRRINKLQEVFDLYTVDSCIVIIKTKKPAERKPPPALTAPRAAGRSKPPN